VFALLLIALAIPAAAVSQTPDTTKKPAEKPAEPPKPSLDFSGVLFANYQYRVDRPTRSANRFDLERAYLTLRASAGERASVRVTTDVFQQQTSPNDSYYRGWTIRIKYAYLQYDFLRARPSGVAALARLGSLHTVVIDHQEQFWPRWISQVPTERFGFFSSADIGGAVQLTLPQRLGEVYATVTNGPGYTSRETDRFKDYAARLSLTPLARGASPLLRTFTLTAWGYKGAIASRFVSGGAGQVGAVGSSLRRDRWGAFAGLRDRRLTLGAEYDERKDEGEIGNNTALSPRAVVDTAGRIASAFAIVRPFELADSTSRIPLGLVFRWDGVKPNTDAGREIRFVIAGLLWDLSRRASLSLDYQEQLPRSGDPSAPLKTYFLHLVANF
jgi:hypothetical protein